MALYYIILGSMLFAVHAKDQRTTLTGSAPAAVAGDPFTFTCSNDNTYMSYVYWTVQLQHNTTRYIHRRRPDDSCYSSDRYKERYNFTCSEEGPFTFTILEMDFKIHHLSNWTCEELTIGGRSNIILLHVNVPIDSVSLRNSQRSPLTVTQGDEVSLVCETNPTKPPSTIIWMMGNQNLTRGVTSQSRDEEGLVVTGSILTLDVTWNANDEGIYCLGIYDDKRKKSEEFLLNVNVPLLEVEMTNFTRTPLTVTENDLVSLECRTNPTRPPASILWVKDGQMITQGVETRMDGEDGRTVTVSTWSFTDTCSDLLTRVQCTGMYGGWNRTGPEVSLSVHCKDREREIQTPKGLGFGAGVGVGVAICLVPVTVLGVLLFIRRRNAEGKDISPHSVVEEMPADVATIQNTYDVMDPSSRQISIRDTYEDIQMYQNTAA